MVGEPSAVGTRVQLVYQYFDANPFTAQKISSCRIVLQQGAAVKAIGL